MIKIDSDSFFAGFWAGVVISCIVVVFVSLLTGCTHHKVRYMEKDTFERMVAKRDTSFCHNTEEIK